MHALRVLEFQLILDRLHRHCETGLGAALADELRPSFKPGEVWYLLSATQEAYDFLSKHAVPSLGPVYDLRPALNRAGKNGVLGGQELFQIADALRAMRSMANVLSPLHETFPKLHPFCAALPDHRRLEELLFDSLDPDGTCRDGASPALAALRAKKKSANTRILERIQSYTTGKHRDLLSDPIYTVRDGRYVIPLKSENRGKIRGIVHDTSGSGQTIYLEPEDVLQLGNALREAEAAERQEIIRILTSLSTKVGAVADEVIGGIEAAAQLDLILAKARLAFDMRGTMPQKVGIGDENHFISIQGGRHPLLDPEKVIPLDISLGIGNSVLITGPNTGGKTVAIKCVGLFVLMAQSGMMPPALDVRLAPFTQVWADIGDEQSLEQSLSTFSGHLKNVAEALRHLKKGAIVLLDEIGAGTDPAEGAALAKSILNEMARKGATILASTHYGELKAFAYDTTGFQNAAMEFDAKSLKPTYRLMLGAPGASNALKIAERYGISKEIVEEARTTLGEQAQDVARMLESLEQSQRQARLAQSEADKRTADLRKAEQKAARKLAEAEDIRKNAHAKAQEVIEAALREIRLEATQIFDEIKKLPKDEQKISSARERLRDLDEVGRDFAKEFAPKQSKRDREALAKGVQVRIQGFTQVGTLTEDPRDGQAIVQIGALKMTVPADRLEVLSKIHHEPAKARPNIRLAKSMHASTEIDLRHMRAEEALRDLEKFVDDAVLAGLPTLRILHGKGEGILRKCTQDYLKKHPAVASFRDADPADGGAGVTVAELS